MNKIFHIKMTKKGEKYADYDTYSDFVVIAKNEDEARKQCLCADECRNWRNDKGLNQWASHDDNVRKEPRNNRTCFWMNKTMTKAVVIGKSRLRTQLVCASFHAG